MAETVKVYPACPPPRLENFVAVSGGRLTLNNGDLRIAMTQTRIRIGCTEITVEAAEKIMAEHRCRFGKPEAEIVIQYA